VTKTSKPPTSKPPTSKPAGRSSSKTVPRDAAIPASNGKTSVPRNAAARSASSKDSAPREIVASRAPLSRSKYFGLVVARFLTLLSLCLWIGGLFFFGAMAAPAMFKISRANGVGELAPQMVGVMLGRFGFVTYACGALLIVGWAIEKWLGAARQSWSKTLWAVQGVCSVVMLAVAIYLSNVLMPQIQKMQPQILSSVKGASTQSTLAAKPVAPQTKARFDALHQNYSGWAMVSVYLGLATLVAFSWRSVLEREA
jgi:uncharacterized membrane protein